MPRSLTRSPTLAPTTQPTLTPTTNPTLNPVTLHPTLRPTPTPTTITKKATPTANPVTISPALTPTPTLRPTLRPTITPTVTPSLTPTLTPTTIPIPSLPPTLSPTLLILTKSPTILPTTLPTFAQINITVNVKKRVDNVFKVHSVFLTDNGIMEDLIQSLLVIPNPTRQDLDHLSTAINSYRYGLGADKLWLIMAIDHLVQGLENDNKLEQLGLTEIASNFHTECVNGGNNHVVTVTSALGSGNISNVIRHNNNDITGIIGNKTFSAITLINITTHDAGSISAMFTSLNVAISNAIGAVASLIDNSITVSACDNSQNIINTIYQTSNPPTVADHINGILACSNWIMNTDNYYITRSTGADCVNILNPSLAFSTCRKYLGEDALAHEEL